MPITLDTSLRVPATAPNTTNANPVTASYTCGAGAKLLIASLFCQFTTRGGGVPTYNGVSMTQVDTIRSAPSAAECAAEMFYLLNPTTGSSLTFSLPNTDARIMVVHLHSYIPTSGFTFAFDAGTGTGNTAANPSHSITTTRSGDLILAALATGANSWNPTGRTGTLLFDEDVGTWGGACQYYVMTGSGAQTMSWTFGTSDDYGIVLGAFKLVGFDPVASTLSGRIKNRFIHMITR